MGRRRAQSAAVALMLTASPIRSHIAIPHLNGLRQLSTNLRRRPLPLLSRSSSHALDTGRRTFATDVKDAHIAVLGGGLTGLTTAYYLAKQLPSTAKVTLYEGSERLGGWIRTEKVDVDVGGKKGVVSFERGPRSLSSLSGNTWRFDDLVLYDLALDLGLKVEDVPTKARYLYYPDHLVTLPPNITLLEMFKEPLFQEAIWGGLGLLLRALRTKRIGDDQSVGDWVRSLTWTKAFADHFASAMVHGIYGGDIEKLSARSVLDRIYWAWYMPNPGFGARAMPFPERDILATLGRDVQIQKLAKKPKGALVHFGAEGMEALPRALAQALRDQPNVEIKMGSPVTRVSSASDSSKVTVETSPEQAPIAYDKVISTLTSQALHRITDAKLPSIADSHSVSIMTVNLWYPEENLKPPGFGYLIPRSVVPEANPEHALGVFFDSDVQTRAPDEPAGTKLFVLMGGHYYDGKTPPSEDEAISQAKTLLQRHLHIPRDTPCHAVAGLARECIPQHYVGHQDRMLALDQDLHTHFAGRLAVAGGSYTRIGAVAALRAGYDIATQTVQQGLVATGLEALQNVASFAVVPTRQIPVRTFREIENMVDHSQSNKE